MNYSTLLNKIGIFLVCLILGACVHFTPETLDRFQKGMPLATTLDIAPISPRSEMTITVSSDAKSVYTIHVYVLSMGDYKSNYFLAFRNDKLVYWGYPHEFARSSDPYINEIGKAAVDEYLRIK